MPVHLYRYSLSEAKRYDEMNLWRDSHKENIRCRDVIDKMVSEQYSRNILPNEIIRSACKEFGIDRVGWVLANTVNENDYDGRYRPDTKSGQEPHFIFRMIFTIANLNYGLIPNWSTAWLDSIENTCPKNLESCPKKHAFPTATRMTIPTSSSSCTQTLLRKITRKANTNTFMPTVETVAVPPLLAERYSAFSFRMARKHSLSVAISSVSQIPNRFQIG